MANISIKRKALRNYPIQRRMPTLFLISAILICSSVYVSPLAYSQELSYFPAWRSFGEIGTKLSWPSGIALDQEGNVYVADTGNNRIQVFSSNGTFISRLGEYGLDEEGLRFPQSIAADSSSGNVYVADTANNRVSAFTYRSPISNVAFSSEEGEIYGNDTKIRIVPIYDGLRSPTAVAFLAANDMLVLQSTDNRIMRIVNGQMLDEPALDLGNSIKIRGCMCDIAILQNDNGTSYAFLYYAVAEVTEDSGNTKVVNSLYRYDITNGTFTNPKLLFEMPSALDAIHFGGKLMIDSDNNIYVTIGDIDVRQNK